MLYGTFIGDISGSRYEFKKLSIITKKRLDIYNTLMSSKSRITDDSIMTVAILDAITSCDKNADEDTLKKAFITKMKFWANKYPNAGYGSMFRNWFTLDSEEPYNSFGNGSAMRVSSIGEYYDSIDRVLEVAKWSAEVTHNHPEGIKGAQAIAACVFMAKQKRSKEDIEKYIKDNFYQNIIIDSFDSVRKDVSYVSCERTVPAAIAAFLKGNDLLDSLKIAILMGGDTDTIAAMTGSISEVYYDSFSPGITRIVNSKLPEDILKFMKDLKGKNPEIKF